MTIVFDPFFPQWALMAIMVIGAVLGLVSLWRHWKSGVFRIIAIAGIIGLVTNPQIRETEKTPLDDIVILLLDETASQSLDGRDRTSASAADEVEQRLTSMGGVEVRRAVAKGEDETRLIDALRTALSDTPRARLAGVFIFSDGQTADSRDVEKLGLDVPVHLLNSGAAREVDRKITLIEAPRYGLVRETAAISFRIDDFTADGEAEPNGSAFVSLRIDGKTVLNQRVPVGAVAKFEAPLDRPGPTIIELEVEERANELTARNNVAVLPITAIRDRLRVLLISGEPHPGERVWRNLLKSDPAVDLVHFTILRPIEKNDGTPISELALIPFPQDELFIEKLSEFDLLIFDRYTYRGVLSSYHFDSISRYVDQGGAVLIASGPEYNSGASLATRLNLSFILPALPAGKEVQGPYRPELTQTGARHPVTADLPEQSFWGRWMRIMPVTKLRGETLMSGPDASPLLILDRTGEGRVGLFLSDHVWLWARGFDGGGPHTELLRRTSHWLMKEPELEEEALALIGEKQSLLVHRRSLSAAAPQVMVTLPSGSVVDVPLQETSPGLFEGRIDNAERGLYRAQSGELFAIGEVGLAAAPEFQNVISTSEHLAPLMDATGGGAFRLRPRAGTSPDAPSLPAIRSLRSRTQTKSGSSWAGIVKRDASRIDTIRDRPLTSPYFWLILIAGALLMAWLIEGGRFSSSREQ